MEKLKITKPTEAHAVAASLYESIKGRLAAGTMPPCPVEFTSALIGLCASQSCGKCVPCRVGLPQLKDLVDSVLDGNADSNTVDLIERSAQSIYQSADCAIGFEAGRAALQAVRGFRDDFMSHGMNRGCGTEAIAAVPCVGACPANVDIPGYIALVREGRYTDAIKLIRKDNPFPIACGLICEHPCELACRRSMVDDAVNIRAIKRYACDHGSDDWRPFHHPSTGKRVAIVGGGPAGLSAAYFLALMGHAPTVFEQRGHLGGMLRYGIPAYRLPRERLDSEIDWIASQGIEVKLNTNIPRDYTYAQLRETFDAVYLAIGAHSDKKLGIPGEEAEGVLSAVQMLRAIGDGFYPDFKGENVIVIGGGNVAMDVARSSVRLGAKSVKIVYRRRIADMTAQEEEIEGAVAEGCEILQLHAPLSIETKDDQVIGLKAQPQIIGSYAKGRPKPCPMDCDPVLLPADRVLVAIGQGIESEPFGAEDIPLRWDRIDANKFGEIEGHPGVFTGGDCETGPATVIRAIHAGKVAARNIDIYLGFDHLIEADVEIPKARKGGIGPCGRSETTERVAASRRTDFDLMEVGYSPDEAEQECSRCLRCDHFGMGGFRGGRIASW